LITRAARLYCASNSDEHGGVDDVITNWGEVEEAEAQEEEEEEEGGEGRGESSKSEASPLPRLHPDLGSLVRWIERAGGFVDVSVHQANEGWSLHANRDVQADTVLVSIPKSLCIFSNPSKMQDDSALMENTQTLMNSLDEKHWRARLAIALLSERVRPNSAFRAYLRNLPFEFWGMPVFFSTSEFNMMQDLTLMQRTKDRCRFLSEFADNVLLPLQKTARDPFSGNSADVNAFGWGFASASSRALRNPAVVGQDGGAVMVPGIDLASHSFVPNCQVIDDGAFYVLKTLTHIQAGQEMTIDYGPWSNDELLSDYGFTVDSNPNEKMLVSCDAYMLDTARVVMGQTKQSSDWSGSSVFGSLSTTASSFNVSTNGDPRVVAFGRGGDKFDERWLQNWQLVWLSALGLQGPGASFAMTIGAATPSSIDPKLWAFLRVLYSQSEKELTDHGYDPFILQAPGSMLSPRAEAHVIRTLVGIVAVMLRVFGTDLDRDMLMLITENTDLEQMKTGGISVMQINSDDIVADSHRIIRNIFSIPHPQPPSPTIRRASQSFSSEGITSMSSSNDVIEKALLGSASSRVTFEDKIASSETPYRVAYARSDSDLGTMPPATKASLEDIIRRQSPVEDGFSVGEEALASSARSSEQNHRITIQENRIAATAVSANEATPPDAMNDAQAAASSQNTNKKSSPLKGSTMRWKELDINTLGQGLPVNVREALR